jgi:hypothetical protein
MSTVEGKEISTSLNPLERTNLNHLMSTVEGKEISTPLDPLERANLNHSTSTDEEKECLLCCVPTKELNSVTAYQNFGS